LVIFAMYVLGIAAAVVVALVLNRTFLKQAPAPFVLELPSYKLPSAKVVLYRVVDRGWAFIRQAGTLIVAVAILVWAVAYYPRNPRSLPADVRQQQGALQEKIAEAEGEGNEAMLAELKREERRLDAHIDSIYLHNSYLARAGRLIGPVVQPLGWDWRIGCAVIASFPAREVVIATLGVIYGMGDEADESNATITETLRSATKEDSSLPAFTTPVALSVMVFFSLCAQCASTLAIIRVEINSWRWPVFTFAYMTILAYLGAMVTYQLGSLWMGNGV
jgi:ferrous iron transport protein B